MKTNLDKFEEFMKNLDQKIERNRLRKIAPLSNTIHQILAAELRKVLKGPEDSPLILWYELIIIGTLLERLMNGLEYKKEIFKEFVRTLNGHLGLPS